jgi:ATP-dependent DNA helicase RecQ
MAMAHLEKVLLDRFRLPAFRLGQKAIMEDSLQKKDVLAVLPTGGGKSLCFQLPAVAENKLVVVVSPLIALMRDQVGALTRLGIPAGSVHSGQTEHDKMDVFRRIAMGGTFLLYVSPERVAKEGFRKWIANKPIALFAIDEAHCISQWGHDFRAEYGELSILKQLRPDVPVLALTASATPLVLRDIERRLGLTQASRHVHGFYRPNLYYQVEGVEEDEKLPFLRRALEQTPEGRVLIYCGTRKSVEDVASRLSQTFPKVGFYHAGLSPKDRTATQEAYGAGELRVLVATNAFGMGIDHPDVRLVVHYHMPANIDALYQEMGRAGRDGHPSTCLMLYSKKDKGLQSFFITRSDAPPEIKKVKWNTLEALVNYSEGGECRHGGVLTYYQDSQRIEACGHCDTCAPASGRKIQRPSASPMAAAEVRTEKKKKAKREAVAAEEGMDGIEKGRLLLLKDWRKRKAKELDVAAFMVFSDKTLRDMAERNPRTREALREVYGIGEQKLEAFGTEVLAELAGS